MRDDYQSSPVDGVGLLNQSNYWIGISRITGAEGHTGSTNGFPQFVIKTKDLRMEISGGTDQESCVFASKNYLRRNSTVNGGGTFSPNKAKLRIKKVNKRYQFNL